jgi:hypothetical protein
MLLQAEVQRLRREVGSLNKRSEAGDDERSSLKLALADAQVRHKHLNARFSAVCAHARLHWNHSITTLHVISISQCKQFACPSL